MYTSSMYTYVYTTYVVSSIPKELNKKGMEYLSILWGYYDGYRIITKIDSSLWNKMHRVLDSIYLSISYSCRGSMNEEM